MRCGYAQFFLKISRTTRAAGSAGRDQSRGPQLVRARATARTPTTWRRSAISTRQARGAASPFRAVAHTPADALAAESHDVDFATVPAHLTFERLLEMVKEKMTEGESLIAALARIAGEGRIEFRRRQRRPGPTSRSASSRRCSAIRSSTASGMGSEEIDQLLRKQLQQRLHSESASGLSLRAPRRRARADHAEPLPRHRRELERAALQRPDASAASTCTSMPRSSSTAARIPTPTVTVDGQQIKLAPDGTFRYHFTLPDGDFAIPIVATSPGQGGAALRHAELHARHRAHRRSRRDRPAGGDGCADRAEVGAAREMAGLHGCGGRPHARRTCASATGPTCPTRDPLCNASRLLPATAALE